MEKEKKKRRRKEEEKRSWTRAPQSFAEKVKTPHAHKKEKKERGRRRRGEKKNVTAIAPC